MVIVIIRTYIDFSSLKNFLDIDLNILIIDKNVKTVEKKSDPGRTRTFDIRLKRALLYHLSYWVTNMAINNKLKCLHHFNLNT